MAQLKVGDLVRLKGTEHETDTFNTGEIIGRAKTPGNWEIMSENGDETWVAPEDRLTLVM